MTRRIYGIMVMAGCFPHSVSAGLWTYASALLCGLLAICSPHAQDTMRENHAVMLYHGHCFPVEENVSISPALLQASMREFDLSEMGPDTVCDALRDAYEGVLGEYEGSQNIAQVVQMVKRREARVKREAYDRVLSRFPQAPMVDLLMRGIRGELDVYKLRHEEEEMLRATGFLSTTGSRLYHGRFDNLRTHVIRCLRGGKSNPTLIGALADIICNNVGREKLI